ncbi:MAG TPA: ABC transporter ATP-binding protein [Acetobacteraceae bacterium]|nr:ABC transporter ATP-binding protein [Acetobacteraceae bacterium]
MSDAAANDVTTRDAARSEGAAGPAAVADAADVPALEVDHVSHSYGARRALDDVSLRVRQARLTALLGPNGAGKTTLFSLITRLFDTRHGSISVLGHRVDREPGEALRRLGVVFQARTLDLDISVMENLLYHAALHGIGGREAASRARAVLAEVELADRARDTARKLSGGQMRRVEIARALLHAPRLLVLDEPTVGLDVASKLTIITQVRRLMREHGVAVLWATHLLDEVEPDDEMVVLHRGRVMAAGGVSEVVRAAGAADLRAAFSALTAGEGGSESA